MRRADRQKRSGAEQDWCSKFWRRAFGLNQRPGRGKATKRAMARRSRRGFTAETVQELRAARDDAAPSGEPPTIPGGHPSANTPDS